MPFVIKELSLPGVLLIEPTIISDDRGFLMETYKHSDFAACGIREPFVQENHSKSVRGTLRGLHYQRAPHGQGKLVRVITGEIFDVAVDMRSDVPSKWKWTATPLSAANRRMVFIPPWCAHGFCVLSETAEILYKTTAEYTPSHEVGSRWNDPALGIEWPIRAPILSDRDQNWPDLA